MFSKFSKKILKISKNKIFRCRKYGTDKQDLRNPLEIFDVQNYLREMMLVLIFSKLVKGGSIVRSIITKNTKDNPEVFDGIDKWAKDQDLLALLILLWKIMVKFWERPSR